jgi:tetratricopeptide (TPR) repeat protein
MPERRVSAGRGASGVIAVVALALTAARPAAAQFFQKNEYQQQKAAAAQYEPAPILVERRASAGPPRVMRLRFYADADFRSGSGVRWQDRLRAQLGQINQVLEPGFGVRLEAESFHRWDRTGPAGALMPMLDELERTDAGAEVDWVVGLVAPLPLVSMSFHDLGVARVLGRHFVLRSMASVAEMDDFMRVFHALDQAQREALYGHRKEHKEIAIFLHEWAHTLGAFHANDPKRIMGPGYSQHSGLISEDDAGLIAAGLGARIAGRGHDTIDWSPLRAFIAAHPAVDWLPAERASLVNLLAASPVRPALPGPTRAGTPGSERPGEPPVAAPLPPFVAAAHAQLRAERRSEALAVVRQAAHDAEKPGTDPAVWLAIAEVDGEIGALTEADAALARAAAHPGAAALASDLLRQRRSLGIPPAGARFAITTDAEPTLVAALQRLRGLLARQQLEAAARAIDEELVHFPGAPGLHALACEAALQSHRARDANRSCAAALAGMEAQPRVHYLTGILQANAGRLGPAMKSLRRATTLSPEDPSYWRTMGQVFEAAGRSKEFAALAAARDQHAAGTPAGDDPAPAAAAVAGHSGATSDSDRPATVRPPAPARPPGPLVLPPSAFTPPAN